MSDKILILDFGSQYTQLIARAVREANTFCEIIPYNKPFEIDNNLKAIILSGSPFSVNDVNAPVIDIQKLITKIPVLGICVGMQILANGSDEGELAGLNWIPGRVKKFDKNIIPNKPKIPHLGWNSIEIKKTTPLLANVDEEDGFYFVHSYYFECDSASDILTTSFYGTSFASSVNREQIFGVQFHPEKSHSNGISLLKNFAEL